LLIFTYGIFFGTNPEQSLAAMKAGGPLAAIEQNIHRGLDLKGGTHLILQVMVNEAVAAESQRTVDQLKDELNKAGVAFTDVSVPNLSGQPELIQIKGASPDKVGDLRRIVTDDFQRYDLQSGAENSYTLVMKPSELTALKSRAVEQSIETIRGRVDALGVSEPVIQEHGLGENQILVQLPGVDDPVRVRQIMQETGMLEIRLVLGGPFASEQEAQSNAASLSGVAMPDATGKGGTSAGYYVLARTAAVSGEDIRSATPGRRDIGGDIVNFTLKSDAGKRFATFTEANVGQRLAVVLSGR